MIPRLLLLFLLLIHANDPPHPIAGKPENAHTDSSVRRFRRISDAVDYCSTGGPADVTGLTEVLDLYPDNRVKFTAIRETGDRTATVTVYGGTYQITGESLSVTLGQGLVYKVGHVGVVPAWHVDDPLPQSQGSAFAQSLFLQFNKDLGGYLDAKNIIDLRQEDATLDRARCTIRASLCRDDLLLKCQAAASQLTAPTAAKAMARCEDERRRAPAVVPIRGYFCQR